MREDLIPGGDAWILSCSTMQKQRCDVRPKQRRLEGPLRKEVTYPPPKGRKFPPCPKYVSTISRTEPPMIGKTEVSPGGLGQWTYRGGSSCDTQISSEWFPAVDIVTGGYANETCKAIFKLAYLVEIWTFADPFSLTVGQWQEVIIPSYGGGYMKPVDEFLEKYLWKWFNVKVDIESRYYDYVYNARYKCVCPDLETSRCLDPATRRAIEKALFDSACVLAGTILAGAVIKLAGTPQGAACLLVGGVIILSANAHIGDEGKPPRRPD
jgi:hypothetical protein